MANSTVANSTNRAATFLHTLSTTVLCLAMLLSALPVSAAEKAETEATLARAAELQREEKFSEAQPILKDTVTTDPASQKAALLHGSNLRHLERYGESETELKRALELRPASWDAQHAAYLLAEVQHAAGKTSDALATIDALEAGHPDSSWLPEALVVKAEILGTGAAEAQARLEKQNAAEEVYEKILDERTTAGISSSIKALKQLAADNPGLPIELQARESVAHLLTKTSENDEAIEVFQSLAHELKDRAPNSRIVQNANYRLAALHHRLDKREAALEYYRESITASAKSDLAENAVLQSAGIAFEILQGDMKADKPISLDQWDDARERMRLAKEDGATTRTRLIADLMTLESYLWSGQSSEAIAAGDRFIDDYSTMTAAYRKEIATAYVALSRVAKQLGNYEECILFAQSVLEMYPEETEMWPGMDHLQRACYDLVEGLYYSGQLKEGDAKLAEFSKRFPDSPYLRAIELGKKAKLYERRQSQSGGSR